MVIREKHQLICSSLSCCQAHAQQNMDAVFLALAAQLTIPPLAARALLSSSLLYNPHAISRHSRSGSRSTRHNMRSPPRFLDARRVAKPMSSLVTPAIECHNPLHTTPTLQPLNTPIYIATDSRSPRTDPTLSVFFKYLPCAFTLSDVP